MPEFKFRPRGALVPIIPTVVTALVLPEALKARYAKPAESSYKASPQQLAYFDWIENGSGNLMLEAGAGCGKSTTLIQGLRLMRGNIFFGAYNKSAAEDIKTKAEELKARRAGVQISTLHAAGLYDWRRMHKTVEIDALKVHKLIDNFIQDNPSQKLAKDAMVFISKMVSFGKQFLIGCKNKPGVENVNVWLKMMDHFSCDMDLPETIQPEQALEWTRQIFADSLAQCETRIDFDDMIYAPIAYDLRLFPNDWVLGDEWQDANPARRELMRRLMKSNARAVFVGDRYQAIYGFTGAGGDSIDKTIEEFNCQKLPLTVTYRCPKTVVTYANQWMPLLESHPDAKDGVMRNVNYVGEQACPDCTGTGKNPAGCVESEGKKGPVLTGATCNTCLGLKRIPAKPWFIQDAPANEDVILCRYTRPLIQTAYGMIKAGVACKVEGRDIGKGLIALARMWKISSLDRLEERLTTYLQREMAKAQKSGSEKRAQEAEDKVATLRIFMERCRSQNRHKIDDLVAEIGMMFDDNVSGVITLCTGHKSKGREWARVYWIQTAQRGRPSKTWEFTEESNIKGVIATRSKAELILVPEQLV